MSRDNVIAVARTYNNSYKNSSLYRYYVISNLNMEVQFNKDYIKNLIKSLHKSRRSTTDRGKALCIGHDIQKKINTEYGVIEIDLF